MKNMVLRKYKKYKVIDVFLLIGVKEVYIMYLYTAEVIMVIYL